MTDGSEHIDAFLASAPWAVVGASSHRQKYGNRVLRAYLDHHLEVYAVNPNATEVEGLPAYPTLKALPRPVRSISVITQPEVTEDIVEDAAEAGVWYVWMQPGAESPHAVSRARELGLRVIWGGPCFLVDSRRLPARPGA